MSRENLMKYIKERNLNRLKLVCILLVSALRLVLNSLDSVTRSSPRPQVYTRQQPRSRGYQSCQSYFCHSHTFSLTRNQSNILITNDSPPRACLSGFGSLFNPHQEHPMSEAADAPVGVKWRYLAPELIHPSRFGLKGANPSQEADVYAFGLLVLEVITAGYSMTVV
jgi:hypothetical protein